METVIEIKNQLRLYMNGPASASMRQKGLVYKLNFGIELPRLKELAAECVGGRRLAMDLWKENVRECKILATMLMPVDECDEELVDVWMEQMPTMEIVEQAVMNLFRRLPYARGKALQWLASERLFSVYAGTLLTIHLLRSGGVFDETDKIEIKDQAEALEHTNNVQVARTARIILENFSLHSKNYV
ncbi:MAG: DNA alkylation repair protein [Bacteroidales bacterium]|nr:DNA alkylation repair protein [Bacteroidales bacterium]